MALSALSSSGTGCVDSTFHFISLVCLLLSRTPWSLLQMPMRSSSRWDQRCKWCLSLFPTQNSRRMTSNLFRFSPVPFPGCLVWICLCLNRSDKVWDQEIQEIQPVSSAPVFLVHIFRLGFLNAFHFQFEQTAVRNVKSSSASTPTPAERPDLKSSRHAKALPFSEIPQSVVLGSSAVRYSLWDTLFSVTITPVVFRRPPVCVGGKKKLYQHYVIGDVCNTASMWLSRWKVKGLSRWTGCETDPEMFTVYSMNCIIWWGCAFRQSSSSRPQIM